MELTIQASAAYIVGMKNIQYTLRDIPVSVDRELRKRARRDHMSLNTATLRAISIGIGLSETKPCFTDLDELAGTWVEDQAIDDALNDLRKVDKELWQ